MNMAFVAGLLDPSVAAPKELYVPLDACLDTRYAVYRNNVTISLIEALEDGFPATRELLGARYFRALAAECVRAHPPVSPMLIIYGEQLPGFIERFPPLSILPWLADVARLEYARRQATDASDRQPLAAGQLLELPADTMPALIPHRHPSARWVDSHWPVLSLWQQRGDPGTREAQQVLVVRPQLHVMETLLPEHGIDFLLAMDGCSSLGQIGNELLQQHPGIDIPALMKICIQTGALSHFT
jgi:hypothetical protein